MNVSSPLYFYQSFYHITTFDGTHNTLHYMALNQKVLAEHHAKALQSNSQRPWRPGVTITPLVPQSNAQRPWHPRVTHSANGTQG